MILLFDFKDGKLRPFLRLIAILCVILLSMYSTVNAQKTLTSENFKVLDYSTKNMMKEYLTNIVDKQFAVRDSFLATLKNAKDWGLRAQTIRDSLASWVGPFPKRTPLKAQINGQIEKEDYIVQNI